jgi:hypothetical protein
MVVSVIGSAREGTPPERTDADDPRGPRAPTPKTDP